MWQTTLSTTLSTIWNATRPDELLIPTVNSWFNTLTNMLNVTNSTAVATTVSPSISFSTSVSPSVSNTLVSLSQSIAPSLAPSNFIPGMARSAFNSATSLIPNNSINELAFQHSGIRSLEFT